MDAAAGSKRKRARKACQLCHQRKLKCGNELPKCNNCTTYGRDCVYLDGIKKPRPSNDRIERLEEENRSLRAQLAQLTPASAEGVSADDLITGASESEPRTTDPVRGGDSPDFHPRSRSTPLSSNNNVLSDLEYHGPSSALFDAMFSRGSEVGEKSAFDLPSEGVISQLMNEAAAQRQAEHAHFAAKKLDLDGIEPDLAEELLSLFWRTPNSTMLLVYRPAFMRDWAVGGDYFSKLLLNAIYHNASRFASELLVMKHASSIPALRSRFRERFSYLLRETLGEIIDKLQAFVYGRPPALQEADTFVPMAFVDRFEELEQWVPLGDSSVMGSEVSPIYSVSVFTRIAKLSIVMNKILNTIYRVNLDQQKSTLVVETLNSLNRDLSEWHQSMPLHLSFSPAAAGVSSATVPAPHTYIQNIMYYLLQILIHRPFVNLGHLYNTLPSVVLESFSTCAAAADNIALYLHSYERVHTFRKAPFPMFYAAYISATIHVRVAKQKQVKTNASTHLRTCLRVFKENSLELAEVRLAISIIRQLMDRIGVEIPDDTVFSDDQPEPQRQSRMTENPRAPGSNSQDPTGNTQIGNGLQWNIGELDFDEMLQNFESPRLSPSIPGWPGLSSASIPGQEGINGSAHPPDDLSSAAIPGDNFFDFDSLGP
ncbi:MAG: hypothetical protein Q9195_003493 [Heterodermia aff. obscurata]